MRPPACLPYCNPHIDAFVGVMAALAVGYALATAAVRLLRWRRSFRIWLVGMVAAVGAGWSLAYGWKEAIAATVGAALWLTVLRRLARDQKGGPSA